MAPPELLKSAGTEHRRALPFRESQIESRYFGHWNITRRGWKIGYTSHRAWLNTRWFSASWNIFLIVYNGCSNLLNLNIYHSTDLNNCSSFQGDALHYTLRNDKRAVSWSLPFNLCQVYSLLFHFEPPDLFIRPWTRMWNVLVRYLRFVQWFQQIKKWLIQPPSDLWRPAAQASPDAN